MKKIIVYVCVMMISLMLSGCKINKPHSAEESSSPSESMVFSDSYDTFSTVDELAEFIIEKKDGGFNSLFKGSSSESDSSEFTVYALKNVPDNYDLYDIAMHGDFISFNYLNDEAKKDIISLNDKLSNNANIENDDSYAELSSSYDESSEEYLNEASKNSNMSKITFAWGYNTDGDVYLQNAVKSFELTEMPNMPGFYYSEARDDYGENIYQIYWSQDGYCFQLNISSGIFNKPEAYGLKSLNKIDFMDLEKINYTLED